MAIERIIQNQPLPEDRSLDLRPEVLDDFIGQEVMKENMKVFIEAAKRRGEMLDHLLLSGPPGLGKTTFSLIVAKEMGVNFKATAATAIEKTGEMASLLSGLGEKEILFIDEIHRLRPVIEEMLYSAMEDFALDLTLGAPGSSKTVKISLPPFTLIGATTKAGSLTQPLLSRFGITSRFEFYTQQELESILARNAQLLKIKLSKDGCEEISRRSRGTPRILNRLLKRTRDFAEVRNESIITKAVSDYALEKMDIDKYGLDTMDRRLMRIIADHFQGGPVGIDNLATSLGEDALTIEDVYEPYLIQIGYLKRTARGRMLTVNGFRYLGIHPSGDNQAALFES